MPLTIAPGFGTTVQYGTVGTYASPTAISGIIEVEPPKKEVESVPTKHMGTTANTETFQPGWIKAGKFKLVIHYDKAVVAAMETLADGTTFKGWIITTNDGTAVGGSTSSTIKFGGFVCGTGTKITIDGTDAYEIEVQQSGALVFTAGT